MCEILRVDCNFSEVEDVAFHFVNIYDFSYFVIQ